MGGSTSVKNFSADEPIFMLEKMNEKFVASVTSAICMSTKALDRTLDIFTEYYWDKIECIIELYAVTIGKDCKNLDENDIMPAFQIFVNMFVDSNVNLLMRAQSVSEIIGVVEEHRTHEDFKPHTVANYDRIDFERKWNYFLWKHLQKRKRQKNLSSPPTSRNQN